MSRSDVLAPPTPAAVGKFALFMATNLIASFALAIIAIKTITPTPAVWQLGFAWGLWGNVALGIVTSLPRRVPLFVRAWVGLLVFAVLASVSGLLAPEFGGATVAAVLGALR